MGDPGKWDERYAEPGFAYGTDPNDFLVSQAAQLPKGRIMSVGAGEGRNEVFLAGLGYDVTAVDSSSVGLAKAEKLAAEQGVTITTLVQDLDRLEVEESAWDGIVSIFCHLPPEPRRELHRRCVAGLKPGGTLVLEGFTPKHLQHKTGGPPVAELMMTLDGLGEDLAGLEMLVARETTREIQEGRFHTGTSHVVQVVARRPNPAAPQ